MNPVREFQEALIGALRAAMVLVLVASATAAQPRIQVGSLQLDGTITGSISVTLATNGASVGFVENRIAFGPEVDIYRCDASPALDGAASTFAFLPGDCSGCGFLNASVSVPPTLSDGVELYSCGVVLRRGVSGEYPLRCADSIADDLSGIPLEIDCGDGVVSVSPVVNLSVGSTTVTSGGIGEIDVTLELLTPTAEAAMMQNSIQFGPEVHILDCEVNPHINRGASASTLRPRGCVPGVDCDSVLTLIGTGAQADPLPDGTVLYTCQVMSVPVGSASGESGRGVARTGTFTLGCADSDASDSPGNPVAATCSDGAVAVVEATPTATASASPSSPGPTSTLTSTPRAMATSSLTATAPQPSPTPTPNSPARVTETISASPTPRSEDEGGCTVAPGRYLSPHWILGSVVIGVLLIRRRGLP